MPNAAEVIRELVSENLDSSVVIGAGTVLDVTTARLAIMAGAEFIVSPTFDQATAEVCNLYQIPYLPGCLTVTEIKRVSKSRRRYRKIISRIGIWPSNHICLQSPLATDKYYANRRGVVGKHERLVQGRCGNSRRRGQSFEAR